MKKADRFKTLKTRLKGKTTNKTPQNHIVYAKAVLALLWVIAKPEITQDGGEQWITEKISFDYIAKSYGISWNTARVAVQHLIEEGWIKLVEKGGYKSAGSRYAIKHIPKGKTE